MSEHITRFYSLALGKYNNFSATTDGLITLGDTTPDVSLVSLLYHNSGAGTLTITDFDNGGEGQLVMIQNCSNGLVAFESSCVVTNSAGLSRDETITFKKHLSKWYEVSRAGGGSEVQMAGETELAATAAGGSNASITILPSTKVLILARSQRTVFKSFSGGYEGQIIRILKINSAHNELGIGTGNIVCTKTASNIVMNASSVALTTMRYNNQWIVSLEGVL
jgi:hypothetical protein